MSNAAIRSFCDAEQNEQSEYGGRVLNLLPSPAPGELLSFDLCDGYRRLTAWMLADVQAYRRARACRVSRTHSVLPSTRRCARGFRCSQWSGSSTRVGCLDEASPPRGLPVAVGDVAVIPEIVDELSEGCFGLGFHLKSRREHIRHVLGH